jgi:hypothetical protein
LSPRAAAEIHILIAGEAEIRRTGLGSQRSSMTCVPRIVDFGAEIVTRRRNAGRRIPRGYRLMARIPSFRRLTSQDMHPG